MSNCSILSDIEKLKKNFKLTKSKNPNITSNQQLLYPQSAGPKFIQSFRALTKCYLGSQVASANGYPFHKSKKYNLVI